MFVKDVNLEAMPTSIFLNDHDDDDDDDWLSTEATVFGQPVIETCEASRFDSNSNRTSRFDSIRK